MNLATNYLGLHLHSPIVPSASPLTENLDNVKRMEDAGAAAIVFHSLFEEQLHHGRHEFFASLGEGTERFAETLPNMPRPESFRVDPDQYLEHLCRAKASVQIPIIASLNGYTEGGWIEFAKQIRDGRVRNLRKSFDAQNTVPFQIYSSSNPYPRKAQSASPLISPLIRAHNSSISPSFTR